MSPRLWSEQKPRWLFGLAGQRRLAEENGLPKDFESLAGYC